MDPATGPAVESAAENGDPRKHRSGDASSEGLAGRIAEASRRQELRDPDEGLGLVDRAVNRVAEIIGVSALAIIVLTIFANAVGRYAFNWSIIWAEELVLLLVPWLAMTGVFLSVRRGTMIRIEYFFEKLPGPSADPSVRSGTCSPPAC